MLNNGAIINFTSVSEGAHGLYGSATRSLLILATKAATIVGNSLLNSSMSTLFPLGIFLPLALGFRVLAAFFTLSTNFSGALGSIGTTSTSIAKGLTTAFIF